MSEKLSAKTESLMPGNMTIHQAFKQIVPFEGNKKAWFYQISRRTGLTPRKVKGLYYGEATDLWVRELSAIQKAIQGHHREAIQLLYIQGNILNESTAQIRRLLSRRASRSGDGLS